MIDMEGAYSLIYLCASTAFRTVQETFCIRAFRACVRARSYNKNLLTRYLNIMQVGT